MNKQYAAWLLAIVSVTAAFRGPLCAQTFWQEYQPGSRHAYDPMDPWQRSIVFRNHIGHGGLFYNCDHEEDKRFSPYIDWGWWSPRPTGESCWECIRQQCREVHWRIRAGATCCWPRPKRMGPNVTVESCAPPHAPSEMPAGQIEQAGAQPALEAADPARIAMGIDEPGTPGALNPRQAEWGGPVERR
jgi:hypothetical protein